MKIIPLSKVNNLVIIGKYYTVKSKMWIYSDAGKCLYLEQNLSFDKTIHHHHHEEHNSYQTCDNYVVTCSFVHFLQN